MMLFERVTKAAADLERMGREEIDKAHRAGSPSYYSDGSGIIREMPDGTRERETLDEVFDSKFRRAEAPPRID